MMGPYEVYRLATDVLAVFRTCAYCGDVFLPACVNVTWFVSVSKKQRCERECGAPQGIVTEGAFTCVG